MNGAARVRAVASLELLDLVRRPIWWVLVLAALAITLSLSGTAFLPRGDGSPGSAEPFVNSRYAIAAFFSLSSMVLYTLFAAILAGLGVIRDEEHRVSQLLHSTPLSASEYIAGKFAGAVVALLLVLVTQLMFAGVTYELLGLGGPVGAFAASNYLVPAVAFAVPAILLFAGVAFAIGVWTRRAIVVFTVPVALVFSLPFFLTWGPPSLSPEVETLLQVLDPSGLRWYTTVALAGPPTVDHVNSATLPWDAAFVLNRLLMVGIGIAAVTSTASRVRGLITGEGRARRVPSGVPEPLSSAAALPLPTPSPGAGPQGAPLRALAMDTKPPGLWRSVVDMARAELRELRVQPALYLFAPLGMGLVWQEGSSAFGPFDEPLILTAGGLAVSTLSLVTFLGCVVLLFHTVESLHRERATGFDRILHSLPFRTSALLIAKNVASAVLMLVFMLAATLAVLSMMALQSQGRVEIVPLLVVWGLVMIPSFVVWNAFVTALWAMLRSRYTVYALGLVALLLTVRSVQRPSMSWVFNWTAAGTLRWSDMGVFDLNGAPLVMNRLLVLSLALLFTVIAARTFARAERDPTAMMGRLGLPALGRSGLRLAPFALVPLLLGGVLQRGISNGFQSPEADRTDLRYWIHNSAEWAGAVAPEVRHVDLRVELEPRLRHLAVEGVYRVYNPGPEVMTDLPFTIRPAFSNIQWTLNGRPVRSEDRFGLHLLTPSEPLAPGAEARIGFVFDATYPEGFTRNGGGLSQFVLPSGVVLHTLRNSFLPTSGFVEGIGRTRENFPNPKPYPVDFWLSPQTAPRPYTTRVEITAPSDYTMNGPGALVSTQEADGRTTAVWESDVPLGTVNIVGGRWDVRRSGETAVYFHPGHDYNVDEILATLVAARERFSEWFYPYPWRELRLSEYPNHDLNAMGFATNIPFSEGLGFLARSDSINRPAFFVTAHEAAHQWWGNILAAGEGPGTGHLVEGMASYAALLLMDSEHGPEARSRLARVMESHYLERRRIDLEKPVGRMLGDQAPSDWIVVYEKGAWVQWMLQEEMGRDAVLTGLRRFIGNYAHSDVRPTLQHMLHFLRDEAPDTIAFDHFVDQWFFDIVLPEFQLSEVRLTEDDGWVVTATVANIGTGDVSVEIVATDEKGGRNTQLVHLAAGQAQRVRWLLDFEPDRLVTDPDVQVLQRNRSGAVFLF